MTMPPITPSLSNDDVNRRRRDNVTIGILTALTDEGAAMVKLIDDVRAGQFDNDPQTYEIGTIPSRKEHQPHHVAMVLLADDGTRQAAVACVDMLRTFPGMHTVIVVGIAGGIPRTLEPERHVRLGDVVVASHGIVDYGHYRQVNGERQIRRQGDGMISAVLRRTARRLAMAEKASQQRPWERWLDPHSTPAAGQHPRPPASTDRLFSRGLEVVRPDLDSSGHRPGVPKVHQGAVGSADILMRDEDARDQLAREFRDLVAVEMEGSGITTSTAEHGATWFMVRGIADYCETTGKNNIWHSYASYAAAAYVRSLLEATEPLSQALPLLPVSEHDQIVELLRQVPTEIDLRVVWNAAVPDLVAPPWPVSGSAVQIFRHLCGRNADESGRPRAVRFVQALAGSVADAEVAAQLRQWVRNWSPASDVAARLGRPGDETPVEPCLLIEIAPDGIDRETCRISSYVQDRTGPWRPHPGPGAAEHVLLVEAEARVGEIIERAEQEEWRDSNDLAAIEFLLPAALLNLPVEWWHPPANDSRPTPLCVDYPVVVRSLERMRHNSRPRTWGSRWKSLNVGRVQWGVSPRTDEQLNAWRVQLRADERIATVVLSAPPDDDSGLDELMIAIKAGVPVILWDRRAPRPAIGEETLLSLVQGDLVGIPARIRGLRAKAAEVPESRRPQQPGAFVVLLWDNPHRVIAPAGKG